MSNLNLITKSALMSPDRVVEPLWWIGHIPFTMWLIEQTSPGLIVELGTHTGNSYFSMCCSVKSNKLLSKCFAIDTWQGDLHQGSYGNEVYDSVKQYNDSNFSEFSSLLRMTFDDALARFSDNTIDLLHIDGLHTYEAVSHDFETWLPKLSDRAIVLFHDVAVKHSDFGVWRLWEELSVRYPNIYFDYSQGLGVLFVGEKQSSVSLALITSWSILDDQKSIYKFFYKLGQSIELEYVRANPEYGISKRDSQIASLYELLSVRDEKIINLAKLQEEISLELYGLREQTAELHRLREQTAELHSLREQTAELHSLREQTALYLTLKSWRIMKLPRIMLRILRRCIRLVRTLRSYHFLNISHKRLHQVPDIALLDKPELNEIKQVNLAVHIHVYYPNLVPELLGYLKNIPIPFDLYLTTDSLEKERLLEGAFSEVKNIEKRILRIAENRARDIGPMIVALGPDLCLYDLVLHLHTKRSPHNFLLRGWRRYLLESLLGNRNRVTRIIQEFVRDPSIGILFPQIFNSVRPCMNIGSNSNNMKILLERAGKRGSILEKISKDHFPAGSMFWFRGSAIQSFVNMQLTFQDFEPELGQIDGTIAHAIERLFIYFAKDRGMKSKTYSTCQFDPDSGVSGFDWFKTYIDNGTIKDPVIIFDHSHGGGTNIYSSLFTKKCIDAGESVLICTFKNNFWFVEWIAPDDGMIFVTSSIGELFKHLSFLVSKRVVVNSLYGYPELSQVIQRVVSLKQSLAATLDYKVHDFYAICPSPHLLNYKNKYCAVPKDHATCNNCLKNNNSWIIKDSWANDINEWRRPFERLFDVATKIIFFDPTAVEIYRKVFNIQDIKISVVPHLDDYFECTNKMDLSGPLHIGILGTLTIVKGGEIVNALASYGNLAGTQTPITVVGLSMLPTLPEIKVLGSYELNELPEIIRGNRINVIFAPSIVPETFAYTISEAMKMGLPIVAFDLGAQGNRVKGYELGRVVPLDSSPLEILDAIQSIFKVAQGKK